VPIPEAKEVMGDATEVRVSWLVGISEALRQKVDLYIAYFSHTKKNMEIRSGNHVNFVAIPREKNPAEFDPNLEGQIRKVYREIDPDVIHIFGTEFPHTLSAVNASEQEGRLEQTVISMQGVVRMCAEKYLAGLPESVCRYYTIRDRIRHCNIYDAQNDLMRRGGYESEALKKAHHVIGRTDFDRRETTQINDKIHYHFNNEILRNSFYHNQWSYESCEPHRIFMSQGGFPYKGFHFAVEALWRLKESYPDLQFYITERDFVHPAGLKESLRENSYQHYVRKLIRAYHLEENIHFLGTLGETEMCEQYLKANVYILPSAIENSPNSLGEAMILGVPAVAADVGGVSSMLTDGEDGVLYPWNEPDKLADAIARMFELKEQAAQFSVSEKRHAEQIFDRNKNIDQLMGIYEEIYEDKRMGTDRSVCI
jgi:glycosyltransferase involved in cell wall biosynthesis